jgi:tRNA pseudouridine38-40 synthase
MARFKIFLEYEGTRYSGWQVQKNARTVQGELINAAAKIFGTKDLELMGSGRTDAGVHALYQVAHLEVATMLAPEIIRMKLNDELPADIAIIEVEKARSTFHARHDATARSYLYQVSRRRTAFGKRFVWWVKDRIDLHAMQEAAQFFRGMKDFRSFTADDPEEKSTKVLIEKIEIHEDGELILVRIVGSHFLWKMVRQIVGVLVEAGRGKLKPGSIAGMFASRTDTPAALTAPPSGLFLEHVYYEGEERKKELKPVLPIGGRTPKATRPKQT